MTIQKRNGVSYLTFDVFENAPLTAAVSCRDGGVSQGFFTSLNMGLHVGDDPSLVVENRKRFFDALGADSRTLINCSQVHGTHIEIVGKEDCGRGALSLDTAIPDTDGLITNEANVPITMNYADCTPLFFYDPKGVIAVSHGGWRGTAGNIVGKTISMMEKKYGSKREDIRAAIGPAIGLECFEVGRDVIEAMKALFTDEEMKKLSCTKENGKFLFDLPGANHVLMRKAGIAEDHIEDCGICTYCHDDIFYSYRKAGGKTGRHMAVMILKN